jgi:hypothetical protein
MATPRFSVVIPTRERAQTLRACLQSCLDQEFTDYEIIVCDNHSSPATRQVVEACASPRIRYVRAPQPLAMSDNWDLALKHARGEFVTVVGDDDGLLSHAFRELDRLITRTGARVIRWDAAFYLWPTVALESEANYLAVPLGRDVQTVDSVTAITEVVNFRQLYTILPMIYNSVIHQDLITRLRAKTGRVFSNNCPDVYSGFAFAYLAGSFLSIEAPMSVSGLSGNSTGVAALLLRRPSEVAREFRQFNARAGLHLHPWVPDLPLFPEIPVADSFQFAKDMLFPGDDRLRLDRKRFAAQVINNLWAADTEEWEARLGVIRGTFSDDPALQKWFDETHGREPFRDRPPPRLRSQTMGYDGSHLHLRTDALGVTDVAGAARLCGQLLGYRGTEVAHGMPAYNRLCIELNQIRARLAEVELDHAARLDVINRLHAQLLLAQSGLTGMHEECRRLQEKVAVSEASRLAALEGFRAASMERIGQLTAELNAIRADSFSRRLQRLPAHLLGYLKKARRKLQGRR